MKNSTTISCPISSERVNENVIRIVAFQVILLTALAIYFQNGFIAIFLAVDFAIRANSDGKFSLLRQIGISFTKILSIQPKPIPAAPKKFAASLGIVFSILVGVFYVLEFNLVALIIASLLILCAVLESVFSVCIGCHVYSFINQFKKK